MTAANPARAFTRAYYRPSFTSTLVEPVRFRAAPRTWIPAPDIRTSARFTRRIQ